MYVCFSCMRAVWTCMHGCSMPHRPAWPGHRSTIPVKSSTVCSSGQWPHLCIPNASGWCAVHACLCRVSLGGHGRAVRATVPPGSTADELAVRPLAPGSSSCCIDVYVMHAKLDAEAARLLGELPAVGGFVKVKRRAAHATSGIRKEPGAGDGDATPRLLIWRTVRNNVFDETGVRESIACVRDRGARRRIK